MYTYVLLLVLMNPSGDMAENRLGGAFFTERECHLEGIRRVAINDIGKARSLSKWSCTGSDKLLRQRLHRTADGYCIDASYPVSGETGCIPITE